MEEKLVDDILDISMRAGALILENGGETYRAEETCVRVAKSMGAINATAFVTPTVVIVSVTDKNNICRTIMRRITKRVVNLQKISRVNSLSRKLKQRGKKAAPYQVEHLLDKIDSSPGNSAVPMVIMAGFSAFFFTLMFKGTLAEAVSGFVIGAMLRIIMMFLDKFHLNSFIVSVICGAFISVLCELTLKFGLVGSSVTMMTAVLMQVVPGMAIVNAIRDLIAGDLMAGTARLVDAFMVAAGLSTGSAFGILVL